MTDTITITTDGACIGNPGPGGLAAIIQHPRLGDFNVTGGDPDTTNNRMELAAVIEALRAINTDPESRNTPLKVRTDSQYVAKAFTDHWLENWQRRGWETAKGAPVLNQDLWQMLLKQMEGHDITWIWVKGHNGDPLNQRADKLAVSAARVSKNADSYWVAPNDPSKATAQTPEPKPTPNAVPEPCSTAQRPYHKGEHAPDQLAEATRLIQEIAHLLGACPDYDSFRTGAAKLFATSRLWPHPTEEHPPNPNTR